MSKFRILNRPDDCDSCSLNSVATGFSEPEGTGVNGVLVVGDSLEWSDAVDGYPFRPYGQSGSVLEKAFGKCGTPRGQFALWNMVACRPPEGLAGYESAIEHCRVHFRRVVARFKPRVILALGAVPLRSLTLMAGKKQNLEMLRGYPLWCEEFHCWVVASYHPNYIARGAWNVFPVLVNDIKQAVLFARHGVPAVDVQYTEDGTEENMLRMYAELEADPTLPLSLDIEDDSLIRKEHKISGPPEITQINVSTREKTGLVVLPSAQNMHTFRRMCALPNPKVGQNHFLYDVVLLEEHYGFYVNGTLEDVMWMFHHLFPDLPQKRSKKDEDDTDSSVETDASEAGALANLQYIASFAGMPWPWKHFNSERPGFYGCADVDAPLRAYWTLRTQMEALGILEGYYGTVVDLMPCLRNMRIRGIPCNRLKLTALHEWLTEAIAVEDAKIQGIVPDCVRQTRPATGYKKIPKDTTGLVLRTYDVKANPNVRCKCFKVRKRKKTDQEGFAFMAYVESEYAHWTDKPDGTRTLRAPDEDCIICGGVGSYSVMAHKADRWAKLLPFNVDSSPQMWEYARYKKYKVGKNSSKVYAMDAETIGRLAKSTNDPLYVTCQRSRKLSKLDSTYALGWLNAIGADESVHPEIGYAPATGQFSSRRPNSQNVPSVSKQGDLAIRFRDAIEAPEGYVLYEADYKSFHAQTLGFQAACPSYIRLAKIDIHSYLAVHLLKIPGREKCLLWADEELKLWLKWHRKNFTLPNGDSFDLVRDGKAKPSILGYGFGLQGPKMYRMNRESFDSEHEAIQTLQMLDGTFPEVARYRNTMPLQAKRGVRLTVDGPQPVVMIGGTKEITNIIITQFNCPRWFHDIQRYDFRKKEVVHGEDWERAIAFAPANVAFGHIKRAMVRLEDSGANERFGLINQIHDALKYCVRRSMLEECHQVVNAEMQKASDVLLMPWDGMKGLQVDVDAKVGQTWAEMKGYPYVN